MSADGMVLLCYDGSPDSRAAIEHAGQLLEGHPATVLTVWEPFIEVLARTPSGYGLAPGMVNVDQVDEATCESARERAREGTELAGRAGLNAQPRTCAQHTTVAAAILAEADAVGADAIVMGSRGLTGLRSLLIGSVSHAVLQHADRTVIVVPSPTVADARHGALRKDREGHRDARAEQPERSP
jgi:nucleotide-binding universal stress UspA family protein